VKFLTIDRFGFSSVGCEGDRTNRSDTYVAREEKPESECKAVAIKQNEAGKRLSQAFGFSG